MVKLAYFASFSALVIGLIGLPVQNVTAVILTNADRDDRTITVIEGENRETQTLKQGALIKDLCPDGCIVRIDDDPKRDFILEGRERVTIEDGLLYYDGEISPEAKSEDNN